MFYDLNIPMAHGSIDVSVQETITRALKYGYQGIAVTTTLDDSVFDKCKREKDKKKNSIPTDSENIIPTPPDLSKIKADHRNVRLFTRVNLRIGDISNIRKFFQFKEIKKYDLVSVEPENQEVLKSLPGIPGFDILSYNTENKCDLNFNRKLYSQFVGQNIYFELVYGPGILDSTARRNLIILSHVYSAVGKSKNIIVSSGAHAAHQIRAPHDVLNFNLLFGLSEEQSMISLTINNRKLLLRARRRRNGKALIEMFRKINEPEK